MIASFLAAIRAAPDDNVPRLILADYLDERGDPRGEFIRTQIELMTTTRSGPAHEALADRERELLEEHEDDWLGPLGDRLYRWWFHRGFLEVSLDIGRFMLDDELIAWPHVAGIHLHPPTYMDADLVARLVRLRRVQRVRSLYLGFEWVQDPIAVRLASARHLKNLTALDLGNNGLTDTAAESLANSTTLPALRVLALANNLITARGAVAFARSAHRSGLRQLDLTNNEIDETGVQALRESKHLKNVEELKLDGNATAAYGRRRNSPARRRSNRNL